MENLTINFIKWIFLAFGIGLLASVPFVDSAEALALTFLGIAFAGTGGGTIGYGWWRGNVEAWLRQNGRVVEADFERVEINSTLYVNGRCPYRVVTQWLNRTTNDLYVFRSENLWFDPSNFVQNRKIRVYIDPGNPSRYYVDLSFLPRAHT